MPYADAAKHLASVDPKLAKVIDRLGACDWKPDDRPEDLFQYLSRVIVYQQLSGRVASAIHRRFLQLFNAGVEPDAELPAWGLRHPLPEEVVAADVDWLRTAGLSRQKAGYIQGLAAQCVNGLASLEDLSQMDDEVVIAELTKVKGVGRWTVEMLLVFRLGRMDVWPVDDLGVRAGLRRFHGLETTPKSKEAMAMGEIWRPFRSVAAYYMWQLMDTDVPE